MTRHNGFSCLDAFRRLDDWLDRRLDPREEESIREHLAICAACASEYRFERGVLDDVRSKIQRVEIPHDLRERVLRALSSEAH